LDDQARGTAHEYAGGLVAVEEIHAEMVSSVWKVLVEPGAQVAAGDTLVILESMKMEIPVLTERAGTVEEMHVVEGEVLQEGDLIATVVAGQSSRA
jgi:biotin carboxyl carrier protein